MVDPAGTGSDNPFVHFRDRLESYRPVDRGALSDDRFIDIVEQLDAAVAALDGRGFVMTPAIDGSDLAAAAGLDVALFIKDETNNVGGSHKARHLFGVAVHLCVAEALGQPLPEHLAIASCGNAALGAAIVARALNLPLEVFVPTWADRSVIVRLRDLGAIVSRCERRQDEAGDPAYLRFREAVLRGARPFSVQGTDTPTTFDGGRTIGWELAQQVADLDALFVQVGGGALATAASLGVGGARLHPVQAAGCAPLARAWDALGPDPAFTADDLDRMRREPEAYMWPWSDPKSSADGILDDITYDWIPLLERTHATGGHPVVAPEVDIERAYELAHTHTSINASATGTAGLAGLLTAQPSAGTLPSSPSPSPSSSPSPSPSSSSGPAERVAVLFTGVDRAS